MLGLSDADESIEFRTSGVWISLGHLKKDVLMPCLQQTEYGSVLHQNYRTSVKQLTNVIHAWELNYCLTSLREGMVAFTEYYSYQYVQVIKSACAVFLDEEYVFIGKALLPIQHSEKVQRGQWVSIRSANFPDHEFGVVNSIIKTISLVPTGNNNQVEISLSDELATSYRKTLPTGCGMKALAKSLPKDFRLIEGFFNTAEKGFEGRILEFSHT
jgi:hypothetical protein